MMEDMQKQMKYIMPIMIGVFAYNFPLGLSLYWNTFTVFTLWRKKKSSQTAPVPQEALLEDELKQEPKEKQKSAKKQTASKSKRRKKKK
jgi:YidC/Oxa1 family membrane protein insertase